MSEELYPYKEESEPLVISSEELIKELSTKDAYGIWYFLDPDFDGHCPCFSRNLIVDGESVEIEGRCWRDGLHNDKQKLYVTGSLPLDKRVVIGAIIKNALDEKEWYNDYVLFTD